MKHLLIILSLILLSSPVIGNNHKGETLYYWSKPDNKWMGFGDKETQHKYQGQVKDGKPNGLGILIFPDGSKYVGNWKNGKYNGQGTSISPLGIKYVGSWKNGKKNGQGTFTHSDGSKYDGSWKNGSQNGQGIYTSSIGDKYVGSWKNDKRWNGIQYDKNGNIIYKWMNGEYIEQ
jgi:hypothetical protein